MSTPAPIIRPEISVPLAGGAVVVRDMPWLDTLAFLKLLATHAKGILAGLTLTEAGKVSVDQILPKIAEIVSGTEELSRILLLGSTGKDEDWLKGLGTLQTMRVLKAALQVNLSDELFALGNELAAELSRIMPAMTTNATPPSAIS